jgi:hypothetical protein
MKYLPEEQAYYGSQRFLKGERSRLGQQSNFQPICERAALEDTTMRSWDYLPQRTSICSMGALCMLRS